MVAPVVPFTKAVDTPDFYRNTNGRRQRRPYNLQLSYTTRLTTCLARSGGESQSANGAGTNNYGSGIDQARSIAYERLLGRISDRASMGENLGQLGQTVHLLRSSLVSLRRNTLALRRGVVPRDWWKLMTQPRRRLPPALANKWLEYTFAVAPTIADIYSAISILQEPVKSPRVTATAKNEFLVRNETSAPFSRNEVKFGIITARYGASVAISNPNLYLANALGLVNPAQTAWQLLPGSFLIDWLLPVEQFLGLGSDFYGLSIQDSYSTWYAGGTSSYWWNSYPNRKSLFRWAEMQRVPDVVLPNLRFRPLKLSGFKRAANAAALAIQAFYPRGGASRRSSR